MGLVRRALPLLLLACLVGAVWPVASASAQEVERLDQAGLIRLVNGSSARVVLVSFWATWCGPCLEEMPNLMRLRREYSEEDVAIIAVSFDFDPEAYRRYLEANPVDFSAYLGTEELMTDLGIEGIPELWLMDRCGTALGGINGLADYEELDRTVREALGDAGVEQQ